MSRRVVVTIDGPAGAGKSTVAKRLAARLGYGLLDTGAIYRSVALGALQTGVDLLDGRSLGDLARNLQIRFELEGDVNHVLVDDINVTSQIRSPGSLRPRRGCLVTRRSGKRCWDLQRRLGASGGVVVEGRDTGTVVFPQAAAKFFLTASPEIRATRRVAELQAAGKDVDFDTTVREIRERDKLDSERAVAPMVAAVDAQLVDSSGLALDDVVATLEARVRAVVSLP
ncbi:MAG: (d)CMP kinase [Myxococcales bacterium]|nr:(d)CMP kinase [Myxococcales bacterium]